MWTLDPTPVLFWDSYETMRRSGPLVGGEAPPAPAAPRLPLDAANIEREHLRRELEAMRSSWSWRITAPLRRLKAEFKRMRGRPGGTRTRSR